MFRLSVILIGLAWASLILLSWGTSVDSQAAPAQSLSAAHRSS